MESAVLVSIIMPVYNVENYIEESLMSVANQTIEKFELILINDGSTDHSEKLIQEFMQAHPNLNIIYLFQENEGQSSARNKGIEAATGQYIYFFDSDDLIEETTIELLYNESIQNELDLLLFSGETFYDSEDLVTPNYRFNYQKNKSYPNIMTGTEVFTHLIHNDEYSTSPCLYFLKRDLLEKNDLEFYEGIIHEDALFTFQLVLSAERSKVISDVLFYRRVREHSTMTDKNYVKSFLGNYTVLVEMINFHSRMNKTNQDVEKAVMDRFLDAFGNAINSYIYMKKSERNEHQDKIEHLKEINQMYDYFNRKDYWLFNKSSATYGLLKKSYDLIK